jgi:hypothetical protein
MCQDVLEIGQEIDLLISKNEYSIDSHVVGNIIIYYSMHYFLAPSIEPTEDNIIITITLSVLGT